MLKFMTLGLAATALIGVSQVQAAEVPTITQSQLVQAINAKKVVLLDVNGSESYKAGHIPGALDYTKVESKLKATLPANKKALVVAYCGNEHCSAYKRGAEAAMKLGYTNVKHFSPGIAGWKASGAKVAKG